MTLLNPSFRFRWDETPRADISETPGHASGWLETPRTDRGGDDGMTPGPAQTPSGATPAGASSKRKSRWDETPSAQTPAAGGATPVGLGVGVTPAGMMAMGMVTPTPGALAAMTPEQMQAYR